MHSDSSSSGGGGAADAKSAIDQISRIQLAELLGSGRHGMVFSGTQEHNGRDRAVAVKVPSEPDGLKNEHDALRRFQHAHIIELLGGPLPNGALILEHCDLGTLATRLSEETLDLSEVGDLLDSLVPALAHMHDHGWIHGDISPGNIGLRSASGPVLLDFATARPADGSAVDEGTAEFAGPHRQADPRLDIRSLAATTLRCLGNPDRWDHKKRHVRELLDEVIEGCDLGAPVELDQLSNIASMISATSLTGAARRGWSGDGPDVQPPTRAFGPRPTDDSSTAVDPAPPSRARLALVLAIALVVLAIVFEVEHFPEALTNDSTLVLASEVSAAETLDAEGARWNIETGVVTITDGNGAERSFAAGDSGDLAAIADWACDGFSSLGVYRPSTGSWFVFSSWEPGSSAEVSLLEPGSTLTVRTDANGCPEPRVS